MRYPLDMNEQSELVTVFRSADPSARDDAQEVCDLLGEAGLTPVVLSDEEAGIPSGACEVRVPPEQAARADEVIAAAGEAAPEAGDPSHDMDLETIFEQVGTTAEVEALGVRGVLDANGIEYVYVEPSPYPNLPFIIKVPRKYADAARKALAEAEAAGAAAAEEEEKQPE